MQRTETRHPVHVPSVMAQPRYFEKEALDFEEGGAGGYALQLGLGSSIRPVGCSSCAEKAVDEKVQLVRVLLQDAPVRVACYVQDARLSVYEKFLIPLCLLGRNVGVELGQGVLI